MIAHLFNAPLGESEAAVGVGTVGSSEAIMLAGLAFKRKWQNKRKAQGLPCDKPNIVTGANVQVHFYVFEFYIYPHAFSAFKIYQSVSILMFSSDLWMSTWVAKLNGETENCAQVDATCFTHCYTQVNLIF